MSPPFDDSSAFCFINLRLGLQVSLLGFGGLPLGLLALEVLPLAKMRFGLPLGNKKVQGSKVGRSDCGSRISQLTLRLLQTG